MIELKHIINIMFLKVSLRNLHGKFLRIKLLTFSGPSLGRDQNWNVADLETHSRFLAIDIKTNDLSGTKPQHLF